MRINYEDWIDFEVSKLFTIEPPAARSIKTYTEGSVPYVSSGGVNNGVVSYLEPKEGEKLEKGNCITVSPLEGTPAFFQDVDFLGRGGAGSAMVLVYVFTVIICLSGGRPFDLSPPFHSLLF